MEFKSAEIKDSVFGNVSKLKGSEFQNISVRNDLTQLQRSEFEKMKKIAEERQNEDESGKFLYRVRGPPGKLKIVKIEKVARGEQQQTNS